MTSSDMDLSHLTAEEKESILAVLERDNALRKAEELRLKGLKDELRALRLRGVLRNDGEAAAAAEGCSRCGERYGRVFNKGAVCVQCLQMVCGRCRQSTPGGEFLCVYCSMQNELEAKCGNWFYSKMPKKSNQVVTGSDVTRASLLRIRPTLKSRRTSTVGSTFDEVCRVLVKTNAPDTEVTHLSCGEPDRKLGPSTGESSSAFHEEDEKNLLKDLLDLRNFGVTAASARPTSSEVKVRQVYGSKYKDSDSSDDDETDRVDSPSICAESVYQRRSNPIRNSLLHANHASSSSCAAGNSASPNKSFHDGTLHFPTHDGLFARPAGQNSRCFEPTDGTLQTACEEVLADDSAETAMVSTSSSSDSNVADDSCVTSIDVAELQSHYKTVQALTSFEENNNNNARSPLSSVSSPADRSSCNLNGFPRDGSQSASSLGSPLSSSMPLIAANGAHVTNDRSIVPVNGVPSDEENEDIGEMFALYGTRRSNSQTNLNKLSVYSNGPIKVQVVQGSKESLNSCYSDAGEENYGKFPVSGEILFGLNYNYTLNVLEITIRRCKDLAVVDAKRNKSDPYVKTYLLPDRTKTGKRKTRVKKHTLDPVYDEVLKYQITKSELETRTLNVMVWNSDRFGRNDFLGEVSMSLDYYPFDNPTPLWHKLRDRSLGPATMLAYKGDLSLCLKFVSAEHISGRRRSPNYRGELQVIVKEARNLSAVRSNGYSDPFCKGYLLPDRSHQSKQKTAVVRKNCNPKWNHTFLFENVSWDELAQRSLEMTIWDYDRLTSNDFLGGVRLNIGNGRSFSQEVAWMDATGNELTLWQSMLDRPNCWIEGTLLLRLNMNQNK